MTDIATASNPAATEARVAAARRGAGVAVLVPCYNEAVTIAKVVRDLRVALPEPTVYVYDNNSTDGTAELAAAAGELVAPIAADEADMTVGDRLSNGSYGKENDRPFHGFGNDLVRWLIRLIYGYSFDDVMTGYRAFSRAFVKTMPVMSAGFQVETEISIWAVDRRWRVADVPVDYRDRPEGSVSKLSTVGDGMLVLAAIASLFRDYRPMAFFGWLSLVLVALGLLAGLPVVGDWLETGLVPRLPSAVLAIALVLCGALSATAGLILDTVAKSHRRQWELSVYQVMEDNGR